MVPATVGAAMVGDALRARLSDAAPELPPVGLASPKSTTTARSWGVTRTLAGLRSR
jgi:hypothetical protein